MQIQNGFASILYLLSAIKEEFRDVTYHNITQYSVENLTIYLLFISQ